MKTKLAQANDLFREGEYESALKIYRKVLDEIPEMERFIQFNLTLAEKSIKSGCAKKSKSNNYADMPASYPDVLLVNNHDYEIVSQSGLFDFNYYCQAYSSVELLGLDPITHYLELGWKEGLNPSENFNTDYYLKIYPDVKESQMNPLIHYIQFGRFENRRTNMLKCMFQKTNLEYDIQMSVIIPTYNRSALLPSLLEYWREVDKVTKYKYEIIFSDDGSDDDSVEILEQVKDLPIIVLKNTHGGASKARNSAILHARGEKLYIIGDDIFPNPQIINQHYEKLKELPICKAVLGEVIWHNKLKINTLMKHITELGCEQFSFNEFQPYGYIDFRHFYTCNISLDREFLISEKNIFNEIFDKYGFEDIELGYRLFKKGMEVYYFKGAYVEHYHPYGSVQSFCKRQQNSGEMALVFKKLHKDQVEWVVQVENISTEWNCYIINIRKYNDLNDLKIIDKIIKFCQELEDDDLIRKFNLEEFVSKIYSVLFRFFYEKGIIKNSYNLDAQTIEKVFAIYFLPRIKQHIESIVEAAHLEFVDLPIVSDRKIDVKLVIEIESYTMIESVRDTYKNLKDDILIRIGSDAQDLDENYFYRPKNGFLLSESNLKQAILFIKNNPSVDIILLSFGLIDFPHIGISKELENNIILKNNGVSLDEIKSNKFSGKVIRLISETSVHILDIIDLIDQSMDAYGYWNKRSSGYIEDGVYSYQFTSFQKNRKIIFVFPIFLAVGGVERNTAEIIEALKNDYDFVVVNFERLNESLGSLHHQFTKNCLGVYDLTELSSHDGILNYLEVLNKFYKPDLVWVCNGCPWMEHNLAQIRIIFNDSALVDQQVYDVNEGWVRLYKEKNQALLSFDRHIAINSKIKNVFISEAKISSDNVDLIYSVMSDEKRNVALKISKEKLLQKYNLNNQQKYIVSIGRITQQKAPLDLLMLIKKVTDKFADKFKFIIVGSGELSCKVNDFIENNKLHNYIIRFEYIENTYELDLISEAIVFTSLYEGLSIALLEALSVGTPAISTDVGDTKLVFEKFKNGIVFDSIGNIDEYFEKFSEFIINYEFYKENANMNKDKIHDMFSVYAIANQYIESFDKALDSKGR